MACSSEGAGAPLWLPVIATMRARVAELLWSIQSSSAISHDDSPSFHPLNALFRQTRTVPCAVSLYGLRLADRWWKWSRTAGRKSRAEGNLCLLLQLYDDLWDWGLLFTQAQSCSNHDHWRTSRQKYLQGNFFFFQSVNLLIVAMFLKIVFSLKWFLSDEVDLR